MAAAFGSGAMTNSIAEIEDASCIFVIGSNTLSCHPLIGRRIIRAKEKGARLIVADPRKIQIGLLADVAVQHRLGTDVALLNGMMHIILRNGWHDADYIAQRTEGFEALKAAVDEYPPERVAAVTGVSVEDLERMSRLYATSKPASLLYAMGITQHTTGVDNVKSVCNLAMLCGNVGVWGGGVNPLRGQNNVQGACDMGGLPNVFPGYQPVNNPQAHEKFSAAWGAKLSDKPGLTITDMVPAMLDGRLKALYIIGENPKLSDPDLNHFNHALKQLDLLVVQDIFPSETAMMADVVFPAASSAEKDGTFTNTERRCMRINRAIDPVGDSLPDWEIVCRVSAAMGHPMPYESAEDIFREITTLVPAYAGISYSRMGIDGLAWPCPTPDHPGTPFLHKDKFVRGKGLFHAVHHKDPAELPDLEYPFFLSTGRMYAHYHTGTMTRVSPHLHAEQPHGYVDIHPEDAARLGVKDGDMVAVTSRRGRVEAPVRLRSSLVPGNVFIPMHFCEAPANVLTSSDAYDPLVKIPEYKVSAVKIEKLEKEADISGIWPKGGAHYQYCALQE